MCFNAGRFEAYSRWLGGAGAFDRTIPSASAVGHDGDDLIIDALASVRQGKSIANPRQIAPHRYSRRFGPLPPCFARATLMPGFDGGPPRLLIGGTASIRGEETVHTDNLERQTAETFQNLAHLIRAAASGDSNGMSEAQQRRWLACFSDMRIYHPRADDRRVIESSAAGTLSPTTQIEYIEADLCRAELLIEIEGLATVS